MSDFALRPHAELPPHHHGRHNLASTVDVYGRAQWLLTERNPMPVKRPYDAVVVTVEPDGSAYETPLSDVRAGFPMFDALPDGGFVVADARSRRRDDQAQVQVFDGSGQRTRSFRVGHAVEHLLTDAEGHLWVGYFDEGVYGDDELSHPGLRRWSVGGEPLWAFTPVPGAADISDCYALTVSGTTAWACAYPDFTLLEARGGRPPRPRANTVRGAKALAVHAGGSPSSGATPRTTTAWSTAGSPTTRCCRWRPAG